MKRLAHFALLCLLVFVLAACSQQSQENPAHNLLGQWRSSKPELGLRVSASQKAQGIWLQIDIETEQCTGSVDGWAQYHAADNSLSLIAPTSYDSPCTVRLTSHGTAASLSEEGACFYYHGLACGFQGNLLLVSQGAQLILTGRH